MSQVEELIVRAAAEVRETTRQLSPPPLPSIRRGRLPRAALAFSVAFAVVVAIGMLPGVFGEPAPPGPSSPGAPLTLPTTTLGDEPPPVECSSTGVPVPVAQADLPEVVASTRTAMIAAATRCDLDALEELADTDLVTSFGGGGFANIRRWEESGEGELGTLLQTLTTSSARVQREDGSVLYVWPAAADYESWDDIPDQYLDELHEVFGEEYVDLVAGFGSYAGWRVGIDETGNWVYFVAGD